MKKKVISTLLAATMVASLLAGCGSAAPAVEEAPAAEEAAAPAEEPAAEEPAEEVSAEGGKVYYLNFKPEQAEQWVALGEVYSEQTGVPVTIETAASGTYESTLKSEMAKSEAPTLFQVNGPVGLANWKDYTYDLKDSDVYAQLKSDDFSLKGSNGEVYAIAYVIETYGIIYNKALVADYCALDGAVIADASEINNFETLKAVAEDMQAKKADLGIEGAFASAGMDASSDWRFKTHLANLPLYYEYENDGMTTGSIKGSYLDNYKAIWDLYINNATCAPSLLSSKTGEDAASEFALGEAVFYQNGTWAYGDIQGNEVADEDLGMLPILIGADGEENQGLCTGSENYWCVNSKASEADIQATLEFLSWVISSDEGRTALSTDMGFVTPFKTFTDEYLPANPLIAAANESIDAGKTAVAWWFTTMPSEEWKNGVGSALLEYAQGTGDWDKVVTAFVDGWATEYAASNAAAE